MAVPSQVSSTAVELDKAAALRQSDPAAAESSYRAILAKQTCKSTALLPRADNLADEHELKDQETALLKLGSLYRDEK